MHINEKIYCSGCHKELNTNDIYGTSAIQPAPDYVNGATIHIEPTIEYFCKKCYIETFSTPQEAIMYEQLESTEKQLDETKQELKEAKGVLHDLGYDDKRIKALYELRHNNALTKDKEIEDE